MMWIRLDLQKKENTLDIKYIQILPAPTEKTTKNLGECLNY